MLDPLILRVQDGGLFATKICVLIFARHDLWPSTNTFPYIVRQFLNEKRDLIDFSRYHDMDRRN